MTAEKLRPMASRSGPNEESKTRVSIHVCGGKYDDSAIVHDGVDDEDDEEDGDDGDDDDDDDGEGDGDDDDDDDADDACGRGHILL